jgi:hypothetical protein
MPRKQRDQFLTRVTARADDGRFHLLHPDVLALPAPQGNAQKNQSWL